MRYATGFEIIEFDNYKLVNVINPWDSSAYLAKYYLVKDENIKVPDDGTKIKIPVESISATSFTHY